MPPSMIRPQVPRRRRHQALDPIRWGVTGPAFGLGASPQKNLTLAKLGLDRFGNAVANFLSKFGGFNLSADYQRISRRHATEIACSRWLTKYPHESLNQLRPRASKKAMLGLGCDLFTLFGCFLEAIP